MLRSLLVEVANTTDALVDSVLCRRCCRCDLVMARASRRGHVASANHGVLHAYHVLWTELIVCLLMLLERLVAEGGATLLGRRVDIRVCGRGNLVWIDAIACMVILIYHINVRVRWTVHASRARSHSLVLVHRARVLLGERHLLTVVNTDL
jgi:hypothetical protein